MNPTAGLFGKAGIVQCRIGYKCRDTQATIRMLADCQHWFGCRSGQRQESGTHYRTAANKTFCNKSDVLYSLYSEGIVLKRLQRRRRSLEGRSSRRGRLQVTGPIKPLAYFDGGFVFGEWDKWELDSLECGDGQSAVKMKRK